MSTIPSQTIQVYIAPLPTLEAPKDLEVVVDEEAQFNSYIEEVINHKQPLERRDLGAVIGVCFTGPLLSVGILASTRYFDQYVGSAGGNAIAAISFIAMAVITMLTITCYLKYEPVDEVRHIPQEALEENRARREESHQAWMEVKKYEVVFLKAMIDSYVEMKVKSAMQNIPKWPQTEDACKEHLRHYLDQQLEALIESSKGTEFILFGNRVASPSKAIFYWHDFVVSSMGLLDQKCVPTAALPAAQVIWEFNKD